LSERTRFLYAYADLVSVLQAGPNPISHRTWLPTVGLRKTKTLRLLGLVMY